MQTFGTPTPSYRTSHFSRLSQQFTENWPTKKSHIDSQLVHHLYMWLNWWSSYTSFSLTPADFFLILLMSWQLPLFIASSSFVSGHVNLKTWLVTENSLAASSAFRLGSEKVDPEVQDYSQLLFLNFGDPVSLCGLKPYIIPGFRLLYCILPGFLPHSRFIEMLLRRVLCRLILAFILLFSDTPNSLIIMIHFIKYIWGLQHTVIGDKMLPIVKQIKTSIISLS